MEYEIGAPGQAYTKWAAQMAVGLGTGVPWVMCKQDDAPDPIVSVAKLSFLLVLSFFLFLACSLNSLLMVSMLCSLLLSGVAT